MGKMNVILNTFLCLLFVFGTVGAPPTKPILLDTDEKATVQIGYYVNRYRFAKMNRDVFLKNRVPIRLPIGTNINLNLFPNVHYKGVVTKVVIGAGSAQWIGYLKNIQYSSFFIIYTSGVFIIHVAHPQGIYEVRHIKNNLYLVEDINQDSLPEG